MYYFLFLYIICISALLKRNIRIRVGRNSITTNNSLFKVLLYGVPLVVASACRDLSIGTDTNGVYKTVYYLGYAIDKWTVPLYECLYIYYVKLVYMINQNYRFLLVITSVIITFSYIYFFARRSKYIDLKIAILSFLVLLYCFSLNGQRQVLAGIFCLITIELIEKEKVLWAIFLVMIASFFHITSVIMFVYFFAYIAQKIKKRIVGIFLFLLGPVIMLFSFSFIIKIPLLTKFITEVSSFNISSINSKFFLFPLLVAPLVLVYRKQLICMKSSNYIHLCGYIFIFTAVLFSGYIWYAFRILYFFVPSEIIIVAQLGKCAKSIKQRNFINIYITFALLVTFVCVYVYHDTDMIYPYRFMVE